MKRGWRASSEPFKEALAEATHENHIGETRCQKACAIVGDANQRLTRANQASAS